MRCDTSLLWTLVEQSDEPGEEANSIASHLESCEACRTTLADIGGEQTVWNDAKQWLAPENEPSEDLDYQSDETYPLDEDVPLLPPIDLSFLEAPSHPEMLGRIGRYDVEGLLGRGGMGVVLRAYDSDLQRSVAVKVMAPEWAASAAARRRFAREAQAAASVAHDNVIPIYNVEADAKLPYLVMRYVPGMTLDGWVRRSGCPDTPTLLRVAGQMAEGLAAAHRRGLVHRDIKPANVLIGENTQRVWITDFGLARAADSVTLTRTGVIAGTPHYMSPEQARGEPIDQRSDLFSLGCVLYFLTTGRPPFDADNTLAVLHRIVHDEAAPLTDSRDDLPPSFVDLVRRMLTRSVDQRPPDCESVLQSLAESQSEVQAGRVAKRPRQWPVRRKTLITAGSIALIFGLVAFLWRQDSLVPTRTAPGSAITDPWSPRPDATVVDPYVAAASERIGSGAVLGRREFDREIARIDRKLDQLENATEVISTPSMDSLEKRWSKEITDIHRALRELESR